MPTRRDVLKTGLCGALGASTMWPRELFGDAVAPLAGSDRPPMRFVFIHKGNGLIPGTLVPPSFDESQMELERRKEAYTVDLEGHTLPEWMSPLANHQQNLTILQGLSGKMCTTGHHTWCSSLGVFQGQRTVELDQVGDGRLRTGQAVSFAVRTH